MPRQDAQPPKNPTIRVAFQGDRGAFSEEAAIGLLGEEIGLSGLRTFAEVVTAVSGGECDYGILPIENSIYGHIAANYDLLFNHRTVFIVDETTLPINQALLGLPGASLEELRTVASHEVAIEQCDQFFKKHDFLERAIVFDTAGAVKLMMERNDPHHGAIGSELLARRYGAQVLAKRIQDDVENVTRFFLLCARPQPRRTPRRACVAFELPHTPGALRDALSTFAERGINLRSLVERPSRLAAFDYRFFVELELGNADPGSIPTIGNSIVLGLY